MPNRIRCDQLEELIKKEKIDVTTQQGKDILVKFFHPVIPDAPKFVDLLSDFTRIEPKLPSPDKKFLPNVSIEIPLGRTREEIIDYLRQLRSTSVTADLAFYAWRDMESCDWLPFIKAAIERSPVSIKMTEKMSLEQVYDWLDRYAECFHL